MVATEISTRNLSLSVQDVKAHVLLIEAFRKLQHELQPGGIPFDEQLKATFPSDSTLRFIQQAVLRFRVWLKSLAASTSVLSPLQREHIPPLDVLMVWHAYMLSPGYYYKDSLERNTILATIRGMPWNQLILCINDTTYTFVPSQEQTDSWERLTSLSFNSKTQDGSYTEPLNLPKFETDLVSAMLRQSVSIDRMLAEVKMYEDVGDKLWIANAYERYVACMRLSIGELVPPMDVDIIWHTHQLSGTRYWDETLSYFGIHIDHDDSQGVGSVLQGRERMRQTLHLLPETSMDSNTTRVNQQLRPERIEAVRLAAKNSRNAAQVGLDIANSALVVTEKVTDFSVDMGEKLGALGSGAKYVCGGGPAQCILSFAGP